LNFKSTLLPDFGGNYKYGFLSYSLKVSVMQKKEGTMKKMSILGICIIALVALATWVPNAFGYTTYRDEGATNCSACHPGFIGGPPSGTLHGAHTAYITGCTPCHQTIGSIPVETGNSNNDQGPGCTGCHQADGLQEHHTNAGAPADGSGLTCANCHPNRTPLPENDAPPYYGTAITSIVDPCSSQPPPGEDASGDNFGLDNQLTETVMMACSATVRKPVSPVPV
jgi:hypothetical protein